MNVFFDIFFKKSGSYKLCFCDKNGKLTIAGQRVIKDLMKYTNSYADNSTAVIDSKGNIDPVRMALNEGKRVVFQRIMYYLNLTDEEIKKAAYLYEQDNNNVNNNF